MYSIGKNVNYDEINDNSSNVFSEYSSFYAPYDCFQV